MTSSRGEAVVRKTLPPTIQQPTVVVVTGLSGAGKSTALRALEDLGFFCVDNLPTQLAPQAVDLCERGGMTRVALGMDVRVRTFLDNLDAALADVARDKRRHLQVLFLDASDEALLRRFSETRRPHPLNSDEADEGAQRGALAVLDGLQLERERLAPIRARATRVIDTTRLSVHELRSTILSHFGPASGGALRMTVRFVSFGFKYGVPVDADIVFDVRFLPNPFFVSDLKGLPGTDHAIVNYILNFEESRELIDRTASFLNFVIPKYEREGKSYLTVAIGCTGGRHRSVVVTDALCDALSSAALPIVVVHRDVQRSNSRQSVPSHGGEP